MKKLFVTLMTLVAAGCSSMANAADPVFSPTFAAECSVKFSPKGGATEQIVSMIDNVAKERIELMTYSFTSEPIANALVRAARRGVKVTAVIDSDEPLKKGNKVAAIRDAGADTNLDKKHAIQHNKVVIIDDLYVHTGSFNFSANADKRNAENSVWCKSKEMVKIYRENFELHKGHSESF